MITGTQLKMARAALGWTARELSAKTKVHKNTIGRIENDEIANQATLLLLRTVLESAGVEFIDGDGPGVRLKGAD